MTHPWFSARLALFFAALFFGIGVHLPFFPVWLRAQGLSAAEIAIVLAAPMIRVIAAPAIALAADRLADRRMPLVALSAVTLAGFAALGTVSGFSPIFILCLLIAVAWTSILPLAETLAVGASIERGLDYGRIRLWGSLTFIAGSVAAGLAVGAWGAAVVLWLLIAAQGVLLALAFVLPRTTSDTPAPRRPRFVDMMALLADRRFVLLLAAAGLTQAAHATYYAFGTLHWRAQGIDDTVIGLLWAAGVVAEIVLFAFSRWALRVAGATTLIALGAAAGVVRWTVTATDPGLATLFAMQLLHAGTFGATHLGTMFFIGERMPRALQASAQGFFSAVAAGILLAGAIALSGPAYAAAGGWTYLGMAGMCLIALGAALALKSRARGVGGVSPTDRPPAPA